MVGALQSTAAAVVDGQRVLNEAVRVSASRLEQSALIVGRDTEDNRSPSARAIPREGVLKKTNGRLDCAPTPVVAENVVHSVRAMYRQERASVSSLNRCAPICALASQSTDTRHLVILESTREVLCACFPFMSVHHVVAGSLATLSLREDHRETRKPFSVAAGGCLLFSVQRQTAGIRVTSDSPVTYMPVQCFRPHWYATFRNALENVLACRKGRPTGVTKYLIARTTHKRNQPGIHETLSKKRRAVCTHGTPSTTAAVAVIYSSEDSSPIVPVRVGPVKSAILTF